MTTFRMMLLGTAAVGLTAAAMSTASAGEVEKTAAVSGHVMRSVSLADDGTEKAVLYTDNNTSSSRIRGTVSAASESLTIGATLELGAYVNRSSTHDITNSSTNTVGMRQSVVTISNNMGSVMVGQGWHPNDTSADKNVSGTGTAALIDGSALHGVSHRASGDKETASGPAVSSITNGFTHSLRNGISYTTPDMSGFSATVAHTSGGSGQIGASYSADYDGTAVSVGAAYGTSAGATWDSEWGAGIGVELAGGLNLSLGYGEQNADTSTADGGTANREDGKMYQGVLGYKMSGLTDMGGTNFAVGYARWDDTDTTAANADESTKVWVAVVQSLTDYGTTVYAAYENYSYDTNADNFSDVKGGTVGIKVLF